MDRGDNVFDAVDRSLADEGPFGDIQSLGHVSDAAGGEQCYLCIHDVGVGVLRDDLELLGEFAELGTIVLLEAAQVVVDFVDLGSRVKLSRVDRARLGVWFSTHTCSHMNLWKRFTWCFEASNERLEIMTWRSDGLSSRVSNVLLDVRCRKAGSSNARSDLIMVSPCLWDMMYTVMSRLASYLM